MGKKKKQEKQDKQDKQNKQEALKKQKKQKQKEKLKKQEKAGKKPAKPEKKSGREDAGRAALAVRDKARDAEKKEVSVAAERFRALGDENRLRILALLADRELCAGDILKSLSIVQSTLSHHMKILVESGLVTCRKQGKWSYYSVDPGLRGELDSLIGLWSGKKQ